MCHCWCDIKALVTFCDLLMSSRRGSQHVNAICHGKPAPRFSDHICLLGNAASPPKNPHINGGSLSLHSFPDSLHNPSLNFIFCLWRTLRGGSCSRSTRAPGVPFLRAGFIVWFLGPVNQSHSPPAFSLQQILSVHKCMGEKQELFQEPTAGLWGVWWGGVVKRGEVSLLTWVCSLSPLWEARCANYFQLIQLVPVCRADSFRCRMRRPNFGFSSCRADSL